MKTSDSKITLSVRLGVKSGKDNHDFQLFLSGNRIDDLMKKLEDMIMDSVAPKFKNSPSKIARFLGVGRTFIKFRLARADARRERIKIEARGTSQTHC